MSERGQWWEMDTTEEGRAELRAHAALLEAVGEAPAAFNHDWPDRPRPGDRRVDPETGRHWIYLQRAR